MRNLGLFKKTFAFYPAIPLLEFYSEDISAKKKTLKKQLFIGIIYKYKILETTKYSYKGNRFNRIWHFLTIEYYKAVKTNAKHLCKLK